MKKKYIVELTSKERSSLKSVVEAQRMSAHKRRHAQMLLKADEGPEGPGWSDSQVAEAFDCKPLAVQRLRQRLVECGFETILEHGNQGSYRAKAVDGVAEAHIIALACGDAPKGHNRWSFRLLADQAVALGIVESCSKSSIHRTLKKMNLSLI